MPAIKKKKSPCNEELCWRPATARHWVGFYYRDEITQASLLSLFACCAASRSPFLFGCLRTFPPRWLCSRAGGGRDAGRTGSPELPPSPGFSRLGSPGLHHWHAALGKTASLLEEEMPAQSLAAPHATPHRAGSSTAGNLGC